MTDQVQHLIDRIRKDAVQASEQKAREVMEQARADAERILAEARATAAETVAQAGRQSQELLERGTRSLAQASRDLLLQVGQQLERLVSAIVAKEAGEALRPEIVEQMLITLADGFARNGLSEGQIDLMVGNEERDHLAQFVVAELRKRLEQGVVVHVDPRMGRGFRVAIAGGTVRHDFTPEAIAEAFMSVLRPQIADVVMKAALSMNAVAAKP